MKINRILLANINLPKFHLNFPIFHKFNFFQSQVTEAIL